MTIENKDRIAIVTGGGRGIGRAISLKLAQDGFTVAAHYGSNRAAADEVVSEIEGRGGGAFVFCAPLEKDGAAHDFWQAYDEAAVLSGFEGKLDVLVNNAGVTLRGTIEELDAADFSLQQRVNVEAPYFIVKQGMQRMRDGGRIINISSGVTRIAFPEIIAYAMTKGAIEAFTLTLAKHLGPRGITVNAVAPGVVDTDINASWLRGNTQAQQNVAQSTALGRVGQPEDVAGVVSFLASRNSGWVTGQILDATGGTQL